jgi:protein-disulfide isomerase-like protein with CxxC motif
MAMDPLTLIFAIGQLVPGILRWVGRDNAAEVAAKAIEVAKTVTGRDEGAAALEALKADPALLVRYQETMNAALIAQLDAETRQLETVNATMRAEYASNDIYVRRARPTFLYVMAATWAVQAVGLLVAIIAQPELAAKIINAAADLTTMWGIALTVVGVAVKARSDDKARAQGAEAPSLTGALANILNRKAPK